MPSSKKKISKKTFTSVSELRQDLVTGDWIVIAKSRARRPHAYIGNGRKDEATSKEDCPFEDLKKSGNLPPVLEYKKSNGDWTLQVVPNKYPAFGVGKCRIEKEEGPYSLMDGAGFHEIVITRDHDRSLAQLSLEEVEEVIKAFQMRYLALMNQECVSYISIFHNHGRAAGGSVYHPHSQLIAVPIVPADVGRSLRGSWDYYQKYRKCVHCVMIEWEIKDKKRIIFENDDYIAFCPFVSRAAFEVRIFPKDHKPYFEKIEDRERQKIAEALKNVLHKLFKGLNDPAYNFFLHTSPCDGLAYDHYHWHFEVLPKTAIWAGFEIGTGIEISTIEPEKAAEYLRRI